MDFARNQTHEPRDFLNSLSFSISIDSLNDLNNRRVECPKCNRKRHLYCYDCMIPLEDILPQINDLPLNCIILQHPRELKSKSSAIHAKVIAGSSVQIVQYDTKEMDELMQNVNKENAILLYPDAKAWSLHELLENLLTKENEKETKDQTNSIPIHQSQTKQQLSPQSDRELCIKKLEYVVFIDSTWQQSGKIFRDDRVHTLTHVKIKTQKTAFWRYQNKGNEFLATIEAIYWLYREYYTAKYQKEYINEYDDLLLLYKYQFDLIQSTYIKNKKSFRKIGGYIEGSSNLQENLEEESTKVDESRPLKRQKIETY